MMRGKRAVEAANRSETAPERPDIAFIAANARSLIANRGDLIKAMKDRDLSVCALVPRIDYLPEIEDLDIPVYQFDLARSGTNPIADIRTLAALGALLHRIRPKVVFAYGIKPVVYGALAAKAMGVRDVYAMITGLGHTYTTESRRTAALRLLTDRLYRAALSTTSAVFFQNPDDLEEFTQSGVLRDREKAVLVNGSGVNLDRFPPHPLPDGPPHFLFIGRLLTEKGIAEFVDAAAIVKLRWPDVRFTAVGNHDPLLPHSVSATDLAEWKSTGHVQFVGGVKDVRPWLESCTVFVLPSYREGTPRSVLEAMATGRAIVTTDAPGCRETAADGRNGYLVPPREVEPLVEAMERYLHEPDLARQQAIASLRVAREKYDVHRVNKRILRAMGLKR